MPAAHRLIKSCIGLLILFVSAILPAQAQKNILKGTILDTAEKKKLDHSIVALINKADSTLYRSFRANADGTFEITKIPSGKYTVMIAYPKMADYLHDITVTDTSKIDLGNVFMITEAQLLEEVVVRAGFAIRMKGDTLEYNADSFAVKPGSNVEELLKRLPGIEVEKDGTIKAQGQEVKKVLVDGDEFFSDDPGLAMKYLQAGAVDKVQVFDERSEQSKFTGMDDGTRNKTINLKLKKNKKNGYFGKLSAGADGKDYYQHEAMGALFTGTRKISVFGVSAKTGKQALAYNDMSKYVAQDYEMINDGTGNVYYYSNNNDDIDGYYGNGLPSVLYGGAHFSDKWNGDRGKVFANYRAKEVNADGWSNYTNTNILPDGTGFTSIGESRNKTHSFMQKGSGSITFALDSFTLLKVSVNGSVGEQSSNNYSTSGSKNEKGFRVNANEQINSNSFNNRKFGSNINYQRKFRKEGRTLAFTFQQDYAKSSSDRYAFAATNYYDPNTGNYKNADTLDQLQQTSTPFQSYAVKGVYTDKFTKEFGVSIEYGWKTAQSSNLFNTFNNANGKYVERVDSLSNNYDFTVNTHITGATLNWASKGISINAGSKLFHTSLDQMNNDKKDGAKRRFINVAPQVVVSLRLPKNTSLSLNYNGQTEQPTIEQLQPLRRTSDRLYVQVGNPDLQPGFRHSGTLSFNKYNMITQSYIYAYASINYTDNAITNARTTDAQNRNVSRYINMDGIVGINGSLGYNWQYKKWHLRPSISTNLGRYGSYSIQNDRKIKNQSLNLGTRASLAHDWKDVMTTSYSASINYNIGRSDVIGNKTNRTVSHTHTLNNNFYLPFKMELGSDCNFTFQPKNSSFNSSISIIQWNAFLQKKFLKSDMASVRFSVNDILNKNTGYTRNVSGNSINESNRFVLKRYWLLTLTWNFTKPI